MTKIKAILIGTLLILSNGFYVFAQNQWQNREKSYLIIKDTNDKDAFKKFCQKDSDQGITYMGLNNEQHRDAMEVRVVIDTWDEKTRIKRIEIPTIQETRYNKFGQEESGRKYISDNVIQVLEENFKEGGSPAIVLIIVPEVEGYVEVEIPSMEIRGLDSFEYRSEGKDDLLFNEISGAFEKENEIRGSYKEINRIVARIWQDGQIKRLRTMEIYGIDSKGNISKLGEIDGARAHDILIKNQISRLPLYLIKEIYNKHDVPNLFSLEMEFKKGKTGIISLDTLILKATDSNGVEKEFPIPEDGNETDKKIEKNFPDKCIETLINLVEEKLERIPSQEINEFKIIANYKTDNNEQVKINEITIDAEFFPNDYKKIETLTSSTSHVREPAKSYEPININVENYESGDVIWSCSSRNTTRNITIGFSNGDDIIQLSSITDDGKEEWIAGKKIEFKELNSTKEQKIRCKKSGDPKDNWLQRFFGYNPWLQFIFRYNPQIKNLELISEQELITEQDGDKSTLSFLNSAIVELLDEEELLKENIDDEDFMEFAQAISPSLWNILFNSEYIWRPSITKVENLPFPESNYHKIAIFSLDGFRIGFNFLRQQFKFGIDIGQDELNYPYVWGGGVSYSFDWRVPDEFAGLSKLISNINLSYKGYSSLSYNFVRKIDDLYSRHIPNGAILPIRYYPKRPRRLMVKNLDLTVRRSFDLVPLVSLDIYGNWQFENSPHKDQGNFKDVPDGPYTFVNHRWGFGTKLNLDHVPKLSLWKIYLKEVGFSYQIIDEYIDNCEMKNGKLLLGELGMNHSYLFLYVNIAHRGPDGMFPSFVDNFNLSFRVGLGKLTNSFMIQNRFRILSNLEWETKLIFYSNFTYSAVFLTGPVFKLGGN